MEAEKAMMTQGLAGADASGDGVLDIDEVGVLGLSMSGFSGGRPPFFQGPMRPPG